ncbi:hypothetical protein J2128_001748 [Methanomicrobium sp. W14]|uniref:hypothetical protein n=1 Tax=Methanomicrobium sp. W14 TaxID=2817839 RepID=UPI001AE93B7E|nr:hypothetical protein [Methanomicrobium sp. W14]MBP2133794.1 hypothetical protein [Methanomicrobium sp. W14]
MTKEIAIFLCLILITTGIIFTGCTSSKNTNSRTSVTIEETKSSTPIETELETIKATIASMTETPAKTPTPSKTPTPTKTINPTKTATQTPSPSKTDSSSAVCSCSGNIYNCDDFKDWSSAQKCYEYCLSATGDDVHDLDRDSDGCACESNKGCTCK